MSLDLTRYFVKIVQCGGFSQAASHLKVPKSTLSKALTKLERETGTTLLLRTTRKQTLTEPGRKFYEACRPPLEALEESLRALQGRDQELAGTIKLTAPEDMGTHLISPVIAKLCQAHPQLSFELDFTSKMVDLVGEGYDLAVRIGALKESGLKSRRLGNLSLILVASPQYLNQHAAISHPRELIQHACLPIMASGMSRSWKLKSKGQKFTAPITVRAESNQMSSALTLAINGAGIALVPHFLCEAALQQKQLVQVLPKWSAVGMPVSVLFTVSTATAARLKLVGDHIIEAIRKKAVEKI